MSITPVFWLKHKDLQHLVSTHHTMVMVMALDMVSDTVLVMVLVVIHIMEDFAEGYENFIFIKFFKSR